MEVRHCSVCRRLIQYPGFGIPMCSDCKKQDDEDFEKVKNYLRDHASATEQEVVDVTEVDPHKILRWLREERLMVGDASHFSLTCESCGEKITTGRYCIKCRSSLAKGFGANRESENKPKDVDLSRKDVRMRFLGGYK